MRQSDLSSRYERGEHDAVWAVQHSGDPKYWIGQKPAYNAQLHNGFKQVDSLLLKPILLNKSNVDVLVKDGFYTQTQLAGK